MLLKKQTLFIASLIILIMSFSGVGFGQTTPDSARAARASALQELLASIEGTPREAPRIYKAEEGYLRFVGAPPESESYSGKSYPISSKKERKNVCAWYSVNEEWTAKKGVKK